MLNIVPCIWVQTSSEVFFRKVNFWDKGGRDAPPVFNVDGVSYLYVKVSAARTKQMSAVAIKECYESASTAPRILGESALATCPAS